MRIFLLICLITIIGCGSHKSESAAWQIAEQSTTNSQELIKFLEHYKNLGDREKYRAACFLVVNMPEKYSVGKDGRELIYDIDIVKSDSLIQSLEYSFNLRDNSPFLKDYSFEQFCEYILPYRIANEPLEYYWKWDIHQRIGQIYGDDIAQYAAAINKNIKTNNSRENWGNPLLGYTATIAGNDAKCDDRAILTVMAMRSYGIPSVMEFIPYWGSTNNGHSLCSVILPNDSIIVFQNTNDDGENIVMSNKTPKIYRQLFSLQRNTTLFKYRNEEDIPNLFSNFRLTDVTSLHNIGKQNTEIEVNKNNPNRLVYLSVFSPNSWMPVAYTERRGRKATFSSIGNGTDTNGKTSTYGENIGNGILYLPCCYSNGNLIPTSKPIIVFKNGNRQLSYNIDDRDCIVVTRKYPRLQRIINFAEQMVGGVFEVATKPDFSDAKEVFHITETPSSKMQRIKVSANGRYVRYRKSKGIFSIGEIKIYDKAGKETRGSVIATGAIEGEEDINLITDGDPLTFFSLSGGIDVWAGIDFNKKVDIEYIEFAPRNDDNEISPGDDYELYYWDDMWVSLGVEHANCSSLIYCDVPKGALLWLRNLTKGKEERPFTFENGQQIWW